MHISFVVFFSVLSVFFFTSILTSIFILSANSLCQRGVFCVVTSRASILLLEDIAMGALFKSF